MRVADVKLDGTSVQFYDDFSGDNIKDINFKCFENALMQLLESIVFDCKI